MNDPKKLPPPSEAEANPPKWADISQAKAEERLWSDEDRLTGVKLGNDILWHQLFGKIVACIMVSIAIIFVASLGVWTWHFLTPWGWLTDDQLSRIQSVIFSGSIGAVVSTYMQRQMLK